MGSIGGMLGLGGGASGTGFQAPQLAPVTQAVTPDQLTGANAQTDQAIQRQQQLLAALQGANGIQNQSQVFSNLGNLSGQLGQIASGQGPNPAQAMLNQQTGANIANQAALMAGQRGVGANAGLLARQAAQQGGALQQQAVGQGAVMQANQSLGALQQQSNVLGQMGNVAGNQVSNQLNQTNAGTQTQQNQQQMLLNALAQQNQANISAQESVNSANAGLAKQGMQNQSGFIGGLMNMGSGALKAHGGEVGYANGGAVAPSGPQSSLGKFLSGAAHGTDVKAPESPEERLKNALASKTAPQKGGLVNVVVSPGEKIVAPEKVEQAAKGAVDGVKVPGEAKVAGDSYANDTVRKKLPPGTIVVPRTKSKSKKSSAEFVRNTLARRGKK